MEKSEKEIMGRCEARNRILAEIKKTPGITKDKLEEMFKHTTIWYNIYKENAPLKDEIIIIPVSTSKGIIIDSYYPSKVQKNEKSNYLYFLIQNYESDSLRDRLKQMSISMDIVDVCFKESIRDEEFIKFLIKYSKKRSSIQFEFEEKIDLHDDYKFWICLGRIACDLLETIETKKQNDIEKEKHLLELIQSTGSFFEKVVFNRKDRSLLERKTAFKILEMMNHPNKYEIAFRLLEKIDTETKFKYHESSIKQKIVETELEAFYPTIEYLIFTYYRLDPIDCKKRLYALLNQNLGKMKGDKIFSSKREIILRDKILYLLDQTREPSHMFNKMIKENIQIEKFKRYGK